MAWTTITDATLATDQPLSSLTMRQLRDNIAAAQNGDTGAPQQQTAGIANNAVTTAKIATDAVTANEIAANAVGSSEIAANAVADSELSKTFSTGSTSLGTSAYWTPTAGLYMWVVNVTNGMKLEINGILEGGSSSSGFIYTDGTSIKLYNDSGFAATINYTKLS